MSDYSDGPFVAIRVFEEHRGWEIDAVDAEGDYSEATWDVWDGERMDKETALAHALDFAAENAPGVTAIQVYDPEVEFRSARDTLIETIKELEQ